MIVVIATSQLTRCPLHAYVVFPCAALFDSLAVTLFYLPVVSHCLQDFLHRREISYEALERFRSFGAFRRHAVPRGNAGNDGLWHGQSRRSSTDLLFGGSG